MWRRGENKGGLMKRLLVLSILLLAGTVWGQDKDCPKQTVSPYLVQQWRIEHDCKYEYLIVPAESRPQVYPEWEYVGPAEISAEKYYGYKMTMEATKDPEKSTTVVYRQNDRFPALLFRKMVCE